MGGLISQGQTKSEAVGREEPHTGFQYWAVIPQPLLGPIAGGKAIYQRS
jgi:hypothetical protein